jgi:hypothetical protein
MHLTNYSVNKNNANYVKNKLGEDQQNSSKWTFDQLRKYYRENGIDDVIIFERIKEFLEQSKYFSRKLNAECVQQGPRSQKQLLRNLLI